MAMHLLTLPWTDLTKEWEPEAFTARTRVLAKTLTEYGHVITYGGEVTEAPVTEHVVVHTRKWRDRHWPTVTPETVFGDYDPSRSPWIEFGVHAADAIRERSHPGDILGITMGISQLLVVNLTSDLGLVPVEVGVGYKGVINTHRVYESWAWRTYHAGLAVGMHSAEENSDVHGDVRNYDEVIPRPYEVEDFPAGNGSGGYFAFMGRVVGRKGVVVASQACQRLGAKLVVAGPGVKEVAPGRLTADDGSVLYGDVEYVGVLDPVGRAQMLGNAIATFTPTLYLEPFGGVHAESLLTGTPVIATPHGCFKEYIQNGVNGYTCSTMAEFVWAAQNAGSLDRTAIRQRAIARYGTPTVGRQYNRYLNRVAALRRQGWYELPPEPMLARSPITDARMVPGGGSAYIS